MKEFKVYLSSKKLAQILSMKKEVFEWIHKVFNDPKEEARLGDSHFLCFSSFNNLESWFNDNSPKLDSFEAFNNYPCKEITPKKLVKKLKKEYTYRNIMFALFLTIVTPEQSEQLQGLFFKLGGKWADGTTEVINTDYSLLYFESKWDRVKPNVLYTDSTSIASKAIENPKKMGRVILKPKRVIKELNKLIKDIEK